MKRVLSIAAVAAVFASVAATAAAQTSTTTNGVSIRVGGFYPTQNDTRSDAGSTWFAAGIDYKLSWLKLPLIPSGGYYSVSFDYAGKGDYENAPLLLNWTSGGQAYFSLGAGVSFTRFPDGGGEDATTRFAYSGAIGWNFKNEQVPLFVELRYLGNDQPRVAGVGAYIGARF